MEDLKPITIITLNISGVNNIIKTSDCQDGLKKWVVHSKHTSNIKT